MRVVQRRLAARGMDPLPTYMPPHEDPQTRPDLAARYPLQLICRSPPTLLNSTFANVESLRRQAGEPTVEIHPEDAARRGLHDGQMVRVFNDRGSYQARAEVGAHGQARGRGDPGRRWWRDTADGVNTNVTTSTRLTDLGGGATFFDNLVEVAGA